MSQRNKLSNLYIENQTFFLYTLHFSKRNLHVILRKLANFIDFRLLHVEHSFTYRTDLKKKIVNIFKSLNYFSVASFY